MFQAVPWGREQCCRRGWVWPGPCRTERKSQSSHERKHIRVRLPRNEQVTEQWGPARQAGIWAQSGGRAAPSSIPEKVQRWQKGALSHNEAGAEALWSPSQQVSQQVVGLPVSSTAGRLGHFASREKEKRHESWLRATRGVIIKMQWGCTDFIF